MAKQFFKTLNYGNFKTKVHVLEEFKHRRLEDIKPEDFKTFSA